MVLELTPEYLLILLANLFLAIIVIVSVKYIAAFISNVNATQELAVKDNPAFGISIAGVILAVTIVMSGAITGETNESATKVITDIVIYGTLGIVLMAVTRFIFDKISMASFSMSEQILKGNVAVAILDAGNVIATAIIIKTILIWVSPETLFDYAMVAVEYVLSQLILTLTAFYRIKIFNNRFEKTLQDAISNGNIAISWRFVGFTIATAFAVTASFETIFIYQLIEENIGYLLWIPAALVIMVIISIMAIIIDKIVLAGINVRDEVDNQHNVAIGVIQGISVVSVAIIILSILN
jgi:hypothetical protein